MPIDYEPIISVADANDAVWFDIVNRTITPQNEASIEDVLVQKDSNSRNFGFHIQRYFESEDLSTKKIRVHYINSLNKHDVAPTHSMEIVGEAEDVVSFKWTISDKVCWENGNVQFAIEFYNDDETYRWFTKPTTVSVTQGICSDGEFIEPESDWFTEYSSRMTKLELMTEGFIEAVDNGEFDGAYAINTFANAIKGNKTDAVIVCDDVSPVRHIAKAKVSGVDNMSDVTLCRCGKNLFDVATCKPTTMNLESNEQSGYHYTLKGNQGTRELVYSAGFMSLAFSQSINCTNKIVISLYITLLEQGVYSNRIRAYGSYQTGGAITLQDIALELGVRQKITLVCDVKSDFIKGVQFYLNNNKILFEVDTMQVEIGDKATEYEEYNGLNCVPNADGIAEFFAVSPIMTLFTNIEGANIEVEYNRDANIVVSEIEKRLNNIQSILNTLNLTNEIE